MSVETASWSDFGSTSWLMMYEEPLITIAANLKQRVKWRAGYQNYTFALVVVNQRSLAEPPSFFQQCFWSQLSSHICKTNAVQKPAAATKLRHPPWPK